MYLWYKRLAGMHTYRDIGVIEAHVESQAKRSNEQNGQNNHSAKSVEDIYEHYNIDAGQREFLYENNEVDPTQKYRQSSNLPLPRIRTETIVEEHKGKRDGAGKEQDFQPIDPTEDIVQALLHKLQALNDQPDECNGNDADGSHKDEVSATITES